MNWSTGSSHLIQCLYCNRAINSVFLHYRLINKCVPLEKVEIKILEFIFILKTQFCHLNSRWRMKMSPGTFFLLWTCSLILPPKHPSVWSNYVRCPPLCQGYENIIFVILQSHRLFHVLINHSARPAEQELNYCTIGAPFKGFKCCFLG